MKITRKHSIKKKLIAILCAPAAAGLAMALPADAAVGTDTKARQGEVTSQQASRNIRASKMIGMNVKNAQGEKLGEIKDLVVDVKNDRVHYAVLEFGGFLGLGEKLFAYPVRTFTTAADRDDLVLNVDKEKLKSAPGFERNKWPDWATYRRDVDRYFADNTVAVEPTSGRLYRASELIGKNVNDRNGKNAGEVEDLVVNMGTGRIHYAVLEFDRSWNLRDKLVPVPMKSFEFPADKGKLVLNVDKSSLDTHGAFDKKRWPDLNDPRQVSGFTPADTSRDRRPADRTSPTPRSER